MEEHPESKVYDSNLVIKKHLVSFSFMCASTTIFRPTLYQHGDYLSDVKQFKFFQRDFLNAFSSLYYLPKLVNNTEEGDTFNFIGNVTPHEYFTKD